MRGGGVKKTTFAKKASNDLKCILDHGFHFLANPPPLAGWGGGGRVWVKKQHLLTSLEMAKKLTLSDQMTPKIQKKLWILFF